MSAVEIVPARPVHVGPIATRMRAADIREAAAFGRTPKDALRQGMIAGRALTVLIHGRAEAMFGWVVTSAIDGEARPWMLGTDTVYTQGRALMTLGPVWIAAMHDDAARLSNWVSAENVRAIRVLERWGFVVEREELSLIHI